MAALYDTLSQSMDLGASLSVLLISGPVALVSVDEGLIVDPWAPAAVMDAHATGSTEPVAPPSPEPYSRVVDVVDPWAKSPTSAVSPRWPPPSVEEPSPFAAIKDEPSLAAADPGCPVSASQDQGAHAGESGSCVPRQNEETAAPEGDNSSWARRAELVDPWAGPQSAPEEESPPSDQQLWLY